MPMKGSLLQDFPFLKRKAAAWHAAHGVEEISLSDNLSGFRHAVDVPPPLPAARVRAHTHLHFPCPLPTSLRYA